MTMFVYQQEIKDLGTCAEALENVQAAFTAIGSLVCAAIESDKDMRGEAWGVDMLIEPQIMRLEQAANWIRENAPHVDRLIFKAERQSMMGAQAPQREAEEVAETGSERTRMIRRDLISEALTKGIDPGEIASAMNMHRSTIEKVRRRLAGEAYSAPDDRAAVNG